jgi:glycosyltransferase involved in cell wall biosynthesis
MPTVSVVIPTHNRVRTLPRAVTSVLGQTMHDFELIIVDDGSTDGTAAYLESLADPRVRVISFASCRGANPARNTGLDAARASIVAFLDSDDAYLAHRLETTLSIFRANPEIELVLSSFVTVEGKRRTTCVNPGCVLDASSLEEALVAHSIYIAGSAITAQAAALRLAGGFDPEVRRMQDRDLLLRMARFTGAALSPDVDWHKFTTVGAISYSRDGYLPSLADLIIRHPVMLDRYRPLVRYLFARPIIADFVQGHLVRAYQSWRFCQDFRIRHSMGIDAPRGYLSGKHARRAIRNRLRTRPPLLVQPPG